MPAFSVTEMRSSLEWAVRREHQLATDADNPTEVVRHAARSSAFAEALEMTETILGGLNRNADGEGVSVSDPLRTGTEA